MHIIYKITNIVNGMFYVGRTSCGLDRRFGQHKTIARSLNNKNKSYLHRAINVYGEQSFEIEEIDRTISLEDAKDREDYHIAILDSSNPKVGYNLALNRRESSHLTSPESSYHRKLKAHRQKRGGPLGYGVERAHNRYIAYLMVDYKKYSLSFESLEEAKENYDKLALYFYKDSAILNYPEKIEYYMLQDLEKVRSQFSTGWGFKNGYRGVKPLRNGEWAVIFSRKGSPSLTINGFQNKEDAGFAHGILSFFYNRYKKNINCYDEIQKLSIEEVSDRAKIYLSNAVKSIKYLKTCFLGVYRGSNNKFYIKTPLFRTGGINFISGFNTENLAVSVYDKICLYLGCDKKYINFYEKVSETSIKDLLSNYNTFFSSKKARKTSVFFGVSGVRNKFSVTINRKYIGVFDSEEEAAQMADRYVLYNSLGQYRLNFPNKISDYEKENFKDILSNLKYNLIKIKDNPSSRFSGVSRKGKNSFEASIEIDKKRYRKTFKDEVDAALFVDNLRILHNKDLQKLNFAEKYK